MQRPRPPIIIGGTGKPRTVRAAVRHADEYNGVYPTVDEARALRATIDEAARAVGREPLRLSMMCDCVVARDAGELHERLGAWRSITGREHGLPVVSGTVDEVAAGLRAYADAGVERVMLQHLCHEDVDMVALLGELGRAIG